jgi:hypothetical protein
MKAGQIRQWDFQSDDLGGKYRLITPLGGGKWVIEDLAPDSDETERILTAPYLTDDAAAKELLYRTERAGRQSTVRFQSKAKTARYF